MRYRANQPRKGQNVSASFKAGGGGSDTANILVTVFGLVLILGALWLGDYLTGTQRERDAAREAAAPPPAAVVEAN